ncbi:MAG: hypothetical protein Q9208_000078 [Pyrenodesmia sp. 3 TL-2023]
MLSTTAHTYGPECSLHAESNVFTRRASAVSTEAPLLRAHFFYSSPLPIDDPLSPVPPPSSKPSASARVPPRPFSVPDNKALEEAWQLQQKARSESEKSKRLGSRSKKDRSSKATDAVHPETEDEVMEELLNAPKREVSHRHAPNDPHLVLCDHPDHVPFDSTLPVTPNEIGQDELEAGIPKTHRTPFRRHNKAGKDEGTDPRSPTKRLSQHFKRSSTDAPYGSSPSERDTTGTPFLRAASRMRSRSRLRNTPAVGAQADGAASASEGDEPLDVREATFDRLPGEGKTFNAGSDSDFGSPVPPSKAVKHERRTSRRRREDEQISVPVGALRLHLVEMPALKMGPIYWNPIHDISSVVRGTWFYKETMLPVPSDVANQLEEGYEYMKPWTQTYNDEVNSCLEIGAEAEMKIVYRLWPDIEAPKDDSRPATAKGKASLLATASSKLDHDQRALKDAINQASKPENRAAGTLEDAKDSIEKKYARCSVIYANTKDAQILQPNQLPSAARARKPLGSIRKGRTIGDAVVRGFDYKIWEKLHPPLKAADPGEENMTSAKATVPRAPLISQDNRKICIACMSADERPRPTDLVLVIHGIGQKLSERVESFHFTHSINAFRRQVNVELENPKVKPWVRQDLGGIMVLPINWRAHLKFEEGGPRPNPNQKDGASSKNEYTLKDITAESLPAVRNLISDVMLDIPYYLSHHKARMIETVVREANRIYRLWCRNNPGFEQYGRVHVIAHSLGSVMALDILSNQPTHLPKLDLTSGRPRNDMFEFDTKSLFFCGSPAGFFLLLNKAPLLPRRDRNKADAEGEDASAGVAGEAGTYGCLAVDNLYNVMHSNDPIAYRLNACVDVDYAYSLQPARVPTFRDTWGQFFSSPFRSKATAPTVPLLSSNLTMPSRPGMKRLPTTVEMETHDFTHEELAEKRMLLLNDNGQIDYTLRSGGGPLEIQYLNMLSAHSSYWVLQDFVSFLVIEIGRKQGRESVVPAIRARKKFWGKDQQGGGFLS